MIGRIGALFSSVRLTVCLLCLLSAVIQSILGILAGAVIGRWWGVGAVL